MAIDYNNFPFKDSHAFIIGIDEYDHFPALRTAVNDARKIAEVLKQDHEFIVHPPLLNATYDQIKKLKKTILERVGQYDRVLFYFAGHGVAFPDDKRPHGCLVPSDAKPKGNHLIPMQKLHEIVEELQCRHFLMILDCCFSGTFKWSSRYRDGDFTVPKLVYQERYDRYVLDPAWQVITSSAYDQKALDVLNEMPLGKREDNDLDHSPFARALFRGLKGAADIIPAEGGDGLITASELYLYLREQVEPTTIHHNEFLRQTPGIFNLEKHDKGEFIFFSPTHPLNLPARPKRNPYKGLQAFEENDMDLFYGRDQVIADLLKKVNEHNFVVVTGASGTGKSSVVKAGLIPKLRNNGYRILPVVRPGKSPIVSLKNALIQAQVITRDIMSAQDEEFVVQKLCEESSGTLLVIDQFEELVTQCKDDKDKKKNAFTDLLYRFLEKNKGNRLKIVVTIRSDFEPHFKQSKLNAYWWSGRESDNARYTVPPFSPEDLREVIVKPSIQEVMYLEPPTLTDHLVNDVIQAPGALPLLSFTLSELYRLYLNSKREDRTLHWDDYKKIGGVSGALQTRADAIYNGLDLPHQETMNKIMLRMVSLEGGDTAGKQVLQEELEFSDEENQRVETIIGKLLKARLIRRGLDDDGCIFVEPAHDALINGWGRLRDWIQNHGEENFVLQSRLEPSVSDYFLKKETRFLWHDNPRLDLLKSKLNIAKSWFNRHEVAFISESINLKNRKKKRTRRIQASVIVVLSVLLTAAVFSAILAKNEADSAKANLLVHQADSMLKENNNVSIRLAEKAYYLDKKPEVMRVLSAAASTTSLHPFYKVNILHDSPVKYAEFSPSGNNFLTLDVNNTIRISDMKGNPVAVVPSIRYITSVRFSPDGRNILTASRDKTAKLWNLKGTLIRSFEHDAPVNSARFSQDGRFVVTASDDFTAGIWDTNRKKQLRKLNHFESVVNAYFSPCCSNILSISRDNIAVIWGTKKNHIVRDVVAARYSHNGKYILTISSRQQVVLRNQNGEVLKKLPYSSTFGCAAFTGNDSGIVIGHVDGSLQLLDLQGKPLKEFRGHGDAITSIKFSPTGTRFLTVSNDKSAKLWNLGGHLIADFNKHKKKVTAASFSKDGIHILTASFDNTARIQDLLAQPTRELNFHRIPVQKAIFSPNGQQVLIISNGCSVHLCDLNGKLTVCFDGHKQIVKSAVFSPDGNRILTASVDKTARLWDLNGNLLLKLDKHKDTVNTAVFSPDGKKILTASSDHTAGLWDLKGNRLGNIVGHTKAVNQATFSPDGTKILTASDDRTARLWSLGGEPLNNFNLHSFPVEFALFSPDGDLVLTIAVVARLWETTGTLKTQYNKYTGNIATAVFSPDGTKILTGSDRNTAKLWDLQGNSILEFKGHQNDVRCVRFAPDGSRILTASADNTVKLWNLQGEVLADFQAHKGIVNYAEFSAAGCLVVSAAADNTVKLWHTPEAVVEWLTNGYIPAYAPVDNSFEEYIGI